MVSKHRLLALVLITIGVAFAACSLITDVDRSKIEGSGGADDTVDSGTSSGGHSATGGSTSRNPDASAGDAGN